MVDGFDVRPHPYGVATQIKSRYEMTKQAETTTEARIGELEEHVAFLARQIAALQGLLTMAGAMLAGATEDAPPAHGARSTIDR
jgi:hypothetical protein